MDTKTLREMALRSAARSDDPHPTGIHWVRSSRAAIAELIGWGLGAAEDGSREQILLMVTGHFTLNQVSRPQGVTSPTGTVLRLVMNLDLTVTDFGRRREKLDLTGLGQIHQIPVN